MVIVAFLLINNDEHTVAYKSFHLILTVLLIQSVLFINAVKVTVLSMNSELIIFNLEVNKSQTEARLSPCYKRLQNTKKLIELKRHLDQYGKLKTFYVFIS